MGIALDLSSLALGPVVEGACQVVGAKMGEGMAAGVLNLLVKRFTDQSTRLTRALDKANDRAWKALEIALAGDSFWERCKVTLARGEDRAFRAQVRDLLDALPLDSLPGGRDEFRRQCGRELHKARKAGALSGETMAAEQLAKRASAFARFHEPGLLLKAQRQTLAHMAALLDGAGYTHLAQLLTLGEGSSLLVLAARYFLRRAIEEDSQLFQGLAFAQLEQVAAGQEQGFAAVEQLLREQGDRLETLLDEVGETVKQTHSAVLDLREELQRQGEQNREVYKAVLEMQARFDLARSNLRPRDSLSIHDERERRLVNEVIARYRGLPEEQRRRQPALLNAIGKLEAASGSFEAAGRDFATVAGLVDDPRSQAEAHLNVYRAALEQRNWPLAQHELLRAIALDGATFAPFPVQKYRLQRILGAGGSGVVFLCDEIERGDKVVVKTLMDESLACGIDQLFTEADVLGKLDHRGIARLRGHGYTDPTERSRPYLVMEYFEGLTLDQYLREQGSLSFGEWLVMARQMAEALRTAHQKKILHRDVKPANVLVRSGKDGLRIQLIDFGLALRQDSLRDSFKQSKTLAGVSIAGTLEYAAPEQLGRLPGVKAGVYSDIYGFGRTCCYALFQTTQPGLKQWESVPRPLAELLGRCVAEWPESRPADFTEVMKGLDRVQWDLRAREIVSSVEGTPLAEPLPRPSAKPSSRIKRAAVPSRSEERRPRRDKLPPSPLENVVGGLPVWIWGVIGLGLLLVFVGGVTFVGLLASSPRTTGPNPNPATSSLPLRPQPAVRSAVSTPRVIEPAVTDPEHRRVYLSDLPEFDLGAFPVFWAFGKNGRFGGAFDKPIRADGRDFAHALGMHPNEHTFSTVKYWVEPAEQFQALAGFDDSADEKLQGDFLFEVLGDGKSLWRSKPVHERGPFQDCRVKLDGVRTLELRVYAPRSAPNRGGIAIWLDPYITRPADYQHPKDAPPYVAYQPPAPIKWADLLGYWSMDEGRGVRAADASANQRHARLVNAEWTTGIRGNAVRCLGPASYVEYGVAAPFAFDSAEPFTFALWMKTTQKEGTLLSQRNKKTDIPLIDLIINEACVKFQVRQDGTDGGTPIEVRSRVKINDGQWHHLAATRKVGNLELFVDGISQERKSGSLAAGAITTDLCALGSERHHNKTPSPWANYHFDGWLDEFCIFSRVLTPQEIAVLAGRTRGDR